MQSPKPSTQHPAPSAQNHKPTFTLLKSIPVNASFLTTDNLGQLYVVVGDELLKYNEKGILINTYSNKVLGNISFVDSSNPLRLLLFYKDFVQIIFLDDALSIIGGSISLEQLGFEQTILSCTSNDNGIWLYDTKDFQIVRLDKNLISAHKSGEINQVLGIEINPNFLIEYDNFVYLNDPDVGILVFDIYGAYYKTIPLKGLSSFQFIGENLFYFSDENLHSYHLKSFEESVIELSDTGVVSARIEKQKLFLLKMNRIDLYLIEE